VVASVEVEKNCISSASPSTSSKNASIENSQSQRKKERKKERKRKRKRKKKEKEEQNPSMDDQKASMMRIPSFVPPGRRKSLQGYP
jgi:hypothetical protein